MNLRALLPASLELETCVVDYDARVDLAEAVIWLIIVLTTIPGEWRGDMPEEQAAA